MTYTCEMKTIESQPTVAVRTRTNIENLSSVIGKAYDDIMRYLGTPPGQYPDTLAYVAYYNMDMQDMEVEMGYVVRQPMSGSEQIVPSSIMGGEYAVCLHNGPYNDLPKAYSAVFQWLAGRRDSTFPNYEFYLNAPGEVDSPQDLRTEVAVRLA